MKPIAVIQNWEIETPGLLAELFDQQQVDYRLYHNYANDTLPEPSELEAAILLGCPISVNSYREHQFLTDLYSFTASAIRKELPLLGICYGGQLIADVLGAKVEPNRVKEIGLYTVSLTESGQQDSLFDGFEQTFEVFHWHGDTFKIPRGSELLVEGVDCKNQSFRKGNAVAVQFHLEVTEHDLAKWCDEYATELTELDKAKEQILTEFNEKKEKLATTNAKFVGNWLDSW